jgi:hypothetical protein
VIALLIGIAGFLRPFRRTSGQGAVDDGICGEYKDGKGATQSVPCSMTGTFSNKRLPPPMLELNLDDFSGLVVSKGSETTQLTRDEIWEILRENPPKHVNSQ